MEKPRRIAVIVFALSLSGCLEEDKGPTQDEFDVIVDEKAVLSEDLEKAYRELDDYDLKFEEFQALEEKAAAAEAAKDLLEKEQEAKEALEEELRKVREEFDAYQKKYEAKVRRDGVGEEMARLEVAGRVLKEVVISSISETELKVRHADGFATLTSATAPEALKGRFFLRSEDEIVARADTLAALLTPAAEVSTEPVRPGREPSEYQLQREERTRQFEAVQALGVEIAAALLTIEAGEASGSGFFAQDGITTYVYTTADSLLASSPLRIIDAKGAAWTQFGDLQSAKGSDMVRIVVTEPVDDVLAIRKPSQEKLLAGVTVAAFGKPSRKQEFSKGVSTLRKVTPGFYECSITALKGAVGGPLVDGNSEVVGIVTLPPTETVGIWGAKSSRSRRARYQVCRLDTPIEWESPVPLTSFMAAMQGLQDFDRVTRLLVAVAALEATEEGFELEARVGNHQSIKEVLNENQQLNIVSQIFRMSEEMKKRKMKVSERDSNRKLRSLFQTVGNSAAKQLLPLESLPPYFRHRGEVSLKARKEASAALEQRVQSLQN